MSDIGLSHIALPVSDIEQSIQFYETYANMQVVHRRIDADEGIPVVWLSDGTRPFVIVLIEQEDIASVLTPIAHLGVGCESRDVIDDLCQRAQQTGCLIKGPADSGYPVGYWAFLRDPDGHTLELSFGQEIGLTLERGAER